MNRGKRAELYFYRDTPGNELDQVLRRGGTLIPIEIKSAATFTPDFLKGIERFRSTLVRRSAGEFVLYGGRERLTEEMVEGW